MGVDGINGGQFQQSQKIKLQQGSSITGELKTIFDEMLQKGLIKDVNGDGFTKAELKNMYDMLNKIHQDSNRSTDYTKMGVGTEFDYTAEEMQKLAEAAGFEVVQTSAEVIEDEVIEDPELPDVQSFIGPPKPPVIEELANGIPTQTTANEQIETEEVSLAKKLEQAETVFEANGQVGKIVDGKYYINGNEVNKNVFDVGKTRAENKKQEILTRLTNPNITNEELDTILSDAPNGINMMNERFIHLADSTSILVTDEEFSAYFKNVNNIPKDSNGTGISSFASPLPSVVATGAEEFYTANGINFDGPPPAPVDNSSKEPSDEDINHLEEKLGIMPSSYTEEYKAMTPEQKLEHLNKIQAMQNANISISGSDTKIEKGTLIAGNGMPGRFYTVNSDNQKSSQIIYHQEYDTYIEFPLNASNEYDSIASYKWTYENGEIKLTKIVEQNQEPPSVKSKPTISDLENLQDGQTVTIDGITYTKNSISAGGMSMDIFYDQNNNAYTLENGQLKPAEYFG